VPTSLRTDWSAIYDSLDETGHAVVPGLIDRQACAAWRSLYTEEARFRRQVVMQNHGYGAGEYRYFGYPLPDDLQALRSGLYAGLVPVANRWQEAMGAEDRFPPDHAAYLDACHAAGQTRATPLILRYRQGDFNRLHQDLYGPYVFPLQVAVLLSEPGRDFEGGEFLLTEQRPRQQAAAEVVPLSQGDAVIFAVNERPVVSKRGFAKARMRHGVSRLRTGERFVLGVIFHDAA